MGLCQVLKPVSLYLLTAIRQADSNRKIMWILKKKIVIQFTDEKYFVVDWSPTDVLTVSSPTSTSGMLLTMSKWFPKQISDHDVRPGFIRRLQDGSRVLTLQPQNGSKGLGYLVLKSNVVPWVKATPYGKRLNQLPVQEPTTTLRPPSRLTS